MKTCPNEHCGAPWFDYYENGKWREGYCQNCAYEEKVPTTNVSNVSEPTKLRPRPRSSGKKREKHWTDV